MCGSRPPFPQAGRRPPSSVPKPWKEETNPATYRHISLLNYLFNTMERMVNWHPLLLLEKQNLLSDVECGFHAGRSPIDHLVSLETRAWEASLQWQHSIVIFFELVKVYDATWHHGIMKTAQMGAQVLLPLSLMNLSFWTFRMDVGNKYLPVTIHENAVPQGSVAINDLPSGIHHLVKSSLLVDDFQIWYWAKVMPSI